jgi:cyanate permease
LFNAALQAVAMIVIGFAYTAHGLILGAILLGATVGNTVVLLPLSILDAFGLEQYSEVYARASLITSFGVAAGPLLLGAIHDQLGGYSVGLTVLGVGSAVAGTILAALRGARAAG